MMKYLQTSKGSFTLLARARLFILLSAPGLSKRVQFIVNVFLIGILIPYQMPPTNIFDCLLQLLCIDFVMNTLLDTTPEFHHKVFSTIIAT